MAFPLILSQVERFMDRVALKEYFTKQLSWGTSHQAQIVFEFLCGAARAAGAGGVVLDAGAGHQRYKPFFDDALYIGQEHPVAGAINKGIREYDILCDVKCIPLMDNSVDVVLSTSSLEHIRDPELFFREANRVLSPGGSLWVHVPFAYHEHETPFDFQRPTRFGLLRWFEDAGFVSSSVKPASSSVYAAIYLMEYAVDEEVERICGGRNASFASDEVRSLTRQFCGMIRKLDQGPQTGTTLPIGWISTGLKAGIRESGAKSWPSAEAFLRARALSAPGVRFEGSQLVLDAV